MKRVPLLPPDPHLSPRRSPQKCPSQSADAEEDETTTSTPKRPNSSGFDVVASTPLLNSNSVSFSSPMAKLGNLHLESEIIEEDDDGGAYSGESFAAADQTIKDSDSDDDDDDYDEPVMDTPPVFTRKRTMNDSDASMNHTPATTASVGTSSYSLKVSFSDSTPCPQPVRKGRNGRKRLKFKPDESVEIEYGDHTNSTTPTVSKAHRHRLLNLQHSIKTPAGEKLSDMVDISMSTPAIKEIPNTPLSQSTPANSRPNSRSGSVPGSQQATPEKARFTTPAQKSQRAMPLSYRLKQSYNRQEYHIVGEFPITSAGLMDENKEGVHPGDKRIVIDEFTTALREHFLSSCNLPILPPLYYTQDELEDHELANELGPEVIKQFYELIGGDDVELLLRSERVRWHPDKWVHSSQNLEAVHHVSAIINSLYEEMSMSP